MTSKPNILFIMADQLRADYLSCTGHPTIKTPNIDALARRGVSFTRTYVQAPVCGGSRMCFYTGRYAFTHGAAYNNFPLRVDEKTMGDFLRPEGYRVALVGKTHMTMDSETFERLGIDPGSSTGVLAAECGFEPYVRDDGLHPDQSVDPELAYNRALRALGYNDDNPWHTAANSGDGDDGETVSGWYLRNAGKPARVKEEHSETAWMTDQAMAFLDDVGDQPWCMHLSYIKPHWPYIAPAPYHDMYTAADILPANRAAHEKHDPNPVYAAFMQHEESVNFSHDEVRELVIPVYMGLISQVDHHVGRIVAYLKERGLADNTIIIMTSDHGDYLGDHWLGEKDLYHEESVRIPLIIVDPSASANATRGTVCDDFVEAIDLAPTFLDWAGGTAQPHLLEGRSIQPLMRGETPDDWRDAVFCDGDFSVRPARLTLGLGPNEARGFMVRTGRWKFVLFERHPPQLFDLEVDPRELNDLGRSAGHEAVRNEMEARLFTWVRRRRLRTTLSDAQIVARTGSAKKRGYIFGEW